MFTFVGHPEIDKVRWDECVTQPPQCLCYALSWYLDIISPGWNALIWEEAGHYLAVIPLPESHKWGVSFVRQPLFTQQLGVFGHHDLPNQAWKEIFAQLQKRVNFVAHYHFNAANTPSLQAFLASQSAVGWSLAHTHHLDLSQSYAQLAVRYTRDRRMNLQRAERAKLTLVESTDIEPLIAMFAQNVAPTFTRGIHPQSYAWLRAIYRALHQRGMASLHYAAGPTGELGAGTLFAQTGSKIIYLFNAAFDHARRANGRTWLLDQQFQRSAGQPLIFDFESPELPEIVSFYRSFGAEPVPFCKISYNHLPRWINAAWWVKQQLGHRTAR